MAGWIGVDFDGTLAKDASQAPVPAMVDRVKRWLAAGIEVRILTARVNEAFVGAMDVQEQIAFLEQWCEEHIGQKLPTTCTKDYEMYQLWDDRAVQVIKDTGERVGNINRPSNKYVVGRVLDEETGFTS